MSAPKQDKTPDWDTVIGKLTEEEADWLIDKEFKSGQSIGHRDCAKIAVKFIMEMAMAQFELGHDKDAALLRTIANNLRLHLDTDKKT